MMRRLIGLVMMVGLVVGVVGCGTENTAGSESNQYPTDV